MLFNKQILSLEKLLGHWVQGLNHAKRLTVTFGSKSNKCNDLHQVIETVPSKLTVGQ